MNYGWQWDLRAGIARAQGNVPPSDPLGALASASVSPVDLVMRWGGRRRLSGFLPVQCAYADLNVIDTLWPDMQPEEVFGALDWYAQQDITLGR